MLGRFQVFGDGRACIGQVGFNGGVDGGGDGEVGMTQIRRKDGTVETLKGCDQTQVQAGEAVIVTTPTAGGFGKA